MFTRSSESIGTDLCRLQVYRAGSGSPVVLWHSLFLDSTSWGTLFGRVAERHSVIAIDGPCHGRSGGVAHAFTFGEVADAAVTVLDHLGLRDPVDWVGNAWGGHVGIQVAARSPGRLRTLTAIGTPVRGLTARERWAMCWPLVQAYRLAGPRPWLRKALVDNLIGPETVAADADGVERVMAAFDSAPRAPMCTAMRSMMLHRPGMATEAARLTLPVLMLMACGDGMGAAPDDARAVAATMADARVVEVAGSGHVAPLLIDVDTVFDQLMKLWDEQPSVDL